MSRRFVFIPLAGSNTGANWMTLPHIKAWGFLYDEEPEFMPIHLDTTLNYADCLPLMERCAIFSAEIEQAIDVPENSTDLPDAVCVALAKMALMPVSRSNSDD